MKRSHMIIIRGLACVTTLCCIYKLAIAAEDKHDHRKISGDINYLGDAKWKDRSIGSHADAEFMRGTYKHISRRKAPLNFALKNQHKSVIHPNSSLNSTNPKTTVLKKQENFSEKIVNQTIGNYTSTSNGSITLENAKHNSTLVEYPESPVPDCSSFISKNKTGSGVADEFCYNPSDSLKCYQDPISCETFHLSGKRELKWPAYGEYSYLSHEHWVKVLQHGGIVFLYHPCAQNSSVGKLRSLADSCMHRYVLTQYHKLKPERPLALVSWGCFLLMDHVNSAKSKQWIKSHAYKGPASHIHKNGTYEHQLVRPAKVLTDNKDSLLCPSEKEKASLHAAKMRQSTTKKKKLLPKRKHVGEEIILKRLQKAKHNAITHSMRQKMLPVDTKKSLAAFGSLVFLSVLLLILLLYTKLWRPRFPPRRAAYVKLGDLDAESEGQYYESNFSLMKTGQDFISSLKRGRSGRKQDSYSRVKLLAPISEDDYEMDEL